MSEEVKIETGELGEISLSFFKSMEIIYSGMPNDKTFALSPVVDEAFLNEGFKFSPTIYYRKSKTQINVLGKEFRVVGVSPDAIVLQYLK